MTTYNTYQEAKIANPDGIIIVLNKPDSELHGKFKVKTNHGLHVMSETDGWIICNPFDFQLPERDYKEQLASIGAQLITPEKKPRTKVKYERVSGCIFDLEDDFNSGVLYCKQGGEYLNITNACSIGVHLASNGLYRRVETPTTEREAFVEALQELWIIDGVDGQEQINKIVNSGEFKIVNHDSDFLRSRIRAVAEWEMNTSNNHDWESVAESIYCAVDDLLKS